MTSSHHIQRQSMAAALLQRLLSPVRRLPLAVWKRGLLVLLLVVFVVTLARIIWLLLLPPLALESWSPAAALPANQRLLQQSASDGQTAAVKVDIQALARLQVFGQFQPQVAAAVQPKAISAAALNAPDTRLNLVLSGVIESNQPQAGRAIIADAGQERLYAPGEQLEKHEQVKVSSILSDRVILENRGKYESLWLYEEEPLPASDRGANVVTRSSHTASRAAPSSSVSLTQETGQLVIDQLVKFSLARKGGDVIGFKIRPGSDPELFARLGLQSGDIVTAVNGLVLDSSARAMEIYSQVRGDRVAQLELLRENNPMSLSIDINQAEQ